MSVNPGFGGQSFIRSALSRLTCIKNHLQKIGREDKVIVQVDGGVSKSNASEIIRAGANSLVAGTAVFGEKDRKAAIAALRC